MIRVGQEAAHAAQRVPARRGREHGAVRRDLGRVRGLREEANGEQSAELVLPEFQRKYLHAKSVAKERKKLMQHLVFDRLATPPTNSHSELQQLEYWSLWIR